MTGWVQLVFTLVVSFVFGIIGYFVFQKAKVPAPALTGSMVANSIATAMGMPWGHFPRDILVLVQIVMGIMLGSMLSKEKVTQMKRLAVPGFALGGIMIVVGLVVSSAVASTTNLDLASALFATAPGGMSEMAVQAMMFDLNVPIVVMFHFLRVAIVYLTIPAIAIYWKRKVAKEHLTTPADKIVIAGGKTAATDKEHGMWLTILIGLASGMVAQVLNIPGGALACTIIGVGFVRSMGLRLKEIPKKSVNIALIIMGAGLGLSFTPEVARLMAELFGVALFFSVATVGIGYCMALLMHKYSGIDKIACLLGCSPAGISQMSAIALDMDVDPIPVSVLQTMRLIIVVIVMPPIIMLIA